MAEVIYNETTGAWERRQLLRSPYIDYCNGKFFITFQVFHNKSVFGAIVGDKCVLNELGLAVEATWRSEPQHVDGLELGEFVVMPNHFHAIVEYHSAARSGAAATIKNTEPATVNFGSRATAPFGDRVTAPCGCRATVRGRLVYSRDPHARDLPYVIGLFKSYTTNIYHRLKATGRCIDIGPHLWQSSFYDELIRDDEQYRNTALYIRHNAANWNSDRFGAVTSYTEGNLALLQGDYVAYLSSEGKLADSGLPMKCYSAARSGAAATDKKSVSVNCGDRATAPCGDRATAPCGDRATAPCGDRATAPCGDRATAPCGDRATAPGRSPAQRPPIISTFTSYYERQVLARCLANNRRFIWVMPGGITAEALAKTAAVRAANLALLLSPVAPNTGVNKQRATWCNQFIAKNADSIWIGHVRPGGSLESILKATIGKRRTM